MFEVTCLPGITSVRSVFILSEIVRSLSAVLDLTAMVLLNASLVPCRSFMHSESKKQIYNFLFLQDGKSLYNKIVFLDFHCLPPNLRLVPGR